MESIKQHYLPEEYQRAITDIANLNTWEKQVSDAQSMMGLVKYTSR